MKKTTGAVPSLTTEGCDDLLRRDLPPVTMVVGDVIPAGLLLLAGDPKAGKSLLAQDLALCIAAGTPAWGCLAVPQGSVLYLANEGGQRSFRARMEQMLGSEVAPTNLRIAYESEPLGARLEAQLDMWLTEHPDARLVVIDTYASVAPETRGVNRHQEDYNALAGLADLANRTRAIFAPRLLNPDATVQRSAFPAPGGAGPVVAAFIPPRALPGGLATRLEPFRSRAPRTVGWAIGACLVASTALLRELGPFDPDVFLYGEDLDLCLRARAAGAAVIYRPDVELLHEGGHSTGTAIHVQQRLEMQARRRRQVIATQLGPHSLRRDDLAEAATYGLRALVGRRRRENIAKLRALRVAQKSPS